MCIHHQKKQTKTRLVHPLGPRQIHEVELAEEGLGRPATAAHEGGEDGVARDADGEDAVRAGGRLLLSWWWPVEVGGGWLDGWTWVCSINTHKALTHT